MHCQGSKSGISNIKDVLTLIKNHVYELVCADLLKVY